MRIDHLTNKEYLKSIKDFPKYFHKDTLVTDEQATKLANDKFALVIANPDSDKIERYYPINNYSNTWVSLKYFNKFASELPLEARIVSAHFLNKAAQAFNIPVSTKLTKLASLAVSDRVISTTGIKTASDNPDNFLLPDHLLYKISSKEDVLDYVNNYHDYVGLLTEEEKKEFDRNLKKFANRYKLAFDTFDTLASDNEVPSLDEIQSKLDVLPMNLKLKLLEMRSIECGPTSHVEEGINLRKMAFEEIKEQGDVGRTKAYIGNELLSKMASLYIDKEIDGYQFANAIYKLDKMFGLDSEYQTSIPDPVKMVVADATDTNILGAMDKEITPILAEYKSGSINTNFMIERVSDTLDNLFSKYANNLLAKYIKTNKDYTGLTKFGSLDVMLQDPVSVFKELDLNEKLNLIKELTGVKELK